MDTWEHFNENRKEGLDIALMSTLPDIAVLGQSIPSDSIKRLFRNLHNTRHAVQLAYAISPRLGRAYELHRQQDLDTHDFSYEYEYKQLPEIPEDSVMLYSGGLDSFILWRLLGQPDGVYFAIGHKAQEKEIEMIKKINSDFGGNIQIERRLNLSDIEMSNGYIPYRNLFFLLMGSYYSNNIVLAQIMEWAPDKNKSFYSDVSALIHKMTSGKFQALEEQEVKVYTPLALETKTSIIERYSQSFDPQEILEYTVSCYSGNEIACGNCSACASRYLALYNNGLEEPYQQVPQMSDFISKFDIRDFKLSQVRMYINRYIEMAELLYKQRGQES